MTLQRHPWDPVLLTTLPHLLCAITAPYPYSAIIAASSISSIMWHSEHEPMNIFFWLDYSFALIWGFCDISQLGVAGLTLNFIAIGTNLLVNRLASAGIYPYERGHALWHLFSCMLTVYKVDLMIRLQKGELRLGDLADSTTPPTL